ncbi:MAG: phosphate acetyltransferase [Desulfobacterales bacterium]|nr:phosphate acetyltransferase [Desulfobacterales bacterium]
MARNLYIAGIEPGSGKSLVALGVMELLSRRVRQVGYFRPVIPSQTLPDNNIRLIQNRYNLNWAYEEMYACVHEDAQSMVAKRSTDSLLKSIVEKYKALESKCQFVLCEGTDFSGVSTAFEFDFNADVADNLGSPILLLVNGSRKTTDDIAAAVELAQESFESKGCSIVATIVNRVATQHRDAVAKRFDNDHPGKNPVYVIPEIATLGKPTIKEIAEELDAQILQGAAEGLYRSVNDYKVAAMKLPNFLDFINDGDLVITPGDRADIILGSMAATASDTFPKIAGLLLTGGLAPDPQIRCLLEGLRHSSAVPILQVQTDTYKTAMNASDVRPRITPGNERKIAAALGIFEAHVELSQLEKQIDIVRSTRRTPIMFEYELIERAKSQRKHIVLPEGREERILRAAEILLRRGVAELTLLGNPEDIFGKTASLGLNLDGIHVIDPLQSGRLSDFASIYYDLRKHKSMTEERARDTMSTVSYFGTMMVHTGEVDGMVSGAVHTTGDTIRPAFEIIRTPPEVSLVSSVFLMCMPDRVLVYGDCAVNPNPNAEQLADIAVSAAETAVMFGIEPRVAMCSYATGISGKGQDVDKVRQATKIAQERRPNIKIEGPIQYDAAVDAGVAKTKLPQSEVAGKATVFVFPDLNTGNNLYKAVQRSANAVAIGPVLQGLNKPVNDLSRGCTVTDIVNTVAITAIQAQALK